MILKNPRLTLLFITLFLVMLGFGIVIPLLPFAVRDLGASSMDMGLLVTVWAGAQFIVAPRWGTFSDRRGRRPAIIIGLIGFGAGFVLMGFATELWMFYVARIIGGLISASTMPAAKAYIADITPPEERSASMGLLGAAFGLGFMLGPAIGGMLAPLGFRFVFFGAGLCGWFTAIIVHLVLPEPEVRTESGLGGRSALGALMESVRQPYAVLYWIPFAMNFAGSALTTMMAFYLMDRFAATEATVGLAFTISGAAGVLTQGILIGPALRWLDEFKLLRLGMILAAIGFVVFTLSPAISLILFCVGFINVGVGLGRPTVTSLLSNITELSQGVTMGLQSSFDALGRMIGPLWAGLAHAWFAEAPYISAAVVYLAALLYLQRSKASLTTSPARDVALLKHGGVSVGIAAHREDQPADP